MTYQNQEQTQSQEYPLLCPVVAAIREIRGGFYADRVENDNTNMIKIGGSDTRICDEMSYYIMSRMMELARFELSRPDLDQCKEFLKKYILSDNIYNDILEKRNHNHVAEQLDALCDIISQMEEIIGGYAARNTTPLNLSLSSIDINTNIDAYNTQELKHTCDAIVDYINSLNINVLLSTPINTQIDHIAEFVAARPASVSNRDIVGNGANLDTPEAALKHAHDLLSRELIVARYIAEIEKYQCAIINHLGKVYDRCENIITQIKM